MAAFLMLLSSFPLFAVLFYRNKAWHHHLLIKYTELLLTLLYQKTFLVDSVFYYLVLISRFVPKFLPCSHIVQGSSCQSSFEKQTPYFLQLIPSPILHLPHLLKIRFLEFLLPMYPPCLLHFLLLNPALFRSLYFQTQVFLHKHRINLHKNL